LGGRGAAASPAPDDTATEVSDVPTMTARAAARIPFTTGG
jgi:hypothetical protein